MYKMIQKSIISENILLWPKKYREKVSNEAFMSTCLAYLAPLVTLETKHILFCIALEQS